MLLEKQLPRRQNPKTNLIVFMLFGTVSILEAADTKEQNWTL